MISMTVLDISPWKAALDAETRAAAAARGRIGVGHLERRPAKVLDIVDGAAVHQVEADGVDDQGHTIRFSQAVALLRLAERETVGKAGTAATVDGQPEYRRSALLGSDERNALRSAGSKSGASHAGEIRSAA